MFLRGLEGSLLGILQICHLAQTVFLFLLLTIVVSTSFVMNGVHYLHSSSSIGFGLVSFGASVSLMCLLRLSIFISIGEREDLM